jgi:hypothetical protein
MNRMHLMIFTRLSNYGIYSPQSQVFSYLADDRDVKRRRSPDFPAALGIGQKCNMTSGTDDMLPRSGPGTGLTTATAGRAFESNAASEFRVVTDHDLTQQTCSNPLDQHCVQPKDLTLEEGGGSKALVGGIRASYESLYAKDNNGTFLERRLAADGALGSTRVKDSSRKDGSQEQRGTRQGDAEASASIHSRHGHEESLHPTQSSAPTTFSRSSCVIHGSPCDGSSALQSRPARNFKQAGIARFLQKK